MPIAVSILLLVLAVAVYARRLREAGWLALLRLAVVVLLALILFDRVVALRWTERPSRVAVLLDRSLSMTVGGADTQALECLRLFPFAPAARTELWALGDSAERIAGGDLSVASDEERPARRTRIAVALRAVARSRPGAVVLISDGRDNGEEDPVKTARESGIPVYAVGCGATGERNLELVRLTFPSAAYVGETVSAVVRLRAAGFDGERAQITLATKTATVTLGRETAEQDVRFDVVFDRPGRRVVRARTDSLPGETNYADNVLDAALEVQSGRVRVAYLTNRPGPTTRFVTGILEGEPRVELVRAEGDERRADVYVLDGIDEVAGGVPIDEVVERVKRGAGALVIAGPDFRPGRVLGALLPGGKGVVRRPGSFTPAPTGLGKSFSWFTDMDVLPPFGVVFAPETGDGAEVWVAGKEDGTTLIASYRVGQGSVVYVAGAPLWRWGFGPDLTPGASPLDAFVSGSVRYLVEQGKDRFSLYPVRPVFHYGEPVTVALAARAPDGGAWAGLDVEVAVDSGPGAPMREVAPGTYEAQFAVLDSGEHRAAAVVRQDDSVVGRAETDVTVSGRELELIRTGLNRELLSAIASVSGAESFRWDSLPQDGFELKRAEFRRGLGFEPRRSVWVYGLIALLVGVELVLRRRRGLL